MAIWFKPKRYGYGAVPTSWQGWAIVIGFFLAVLALVWGLIGVDPLTSPDGGRLAFFFTLVAILVIAVWIVSKRTTDGEWRWRWGENSK